MTETSPPPATVISQTATRRLGIWVAALTLVSDQASKLWLLFVADIAERGPFQVLPFLEFVLAWNRGISYGLFQQSSDFGRWALVAVSVVASVWLSTWMWRETSRLTVLALALIIGGALGNGIDRAAYGAVVDFAHVHVGSFSWYIFNIADAAIVAGVVALLYDSFRPGSTNAL